MKTPKYFNLIKLMLLSCTAFVSQDGLAENAGWSVVPFVGGSLIANQSGDITGAQDISNGPLDVQLDDGFVAGLGLRYDYKNSPWSAEFSWEYRSNDSSTTASDGNELPGGNYASNVFALNGRYAFSRKGAFTPWLGSGLIYVQEIDLDSENADGERSFSNSGEIGLQFMVGLDYSISRRFYLSSELRYSSITGIDLDEEGGAGRIANLDYQPLTLGIGVGFRF